MASGSGKNANTSQDLVIYEPTTWHVVYAGVEVNRPSATVCNPHAWIPQLFAHLQNAEEHVRLLGKAREEPDAMEIDISDMHSYFEIPKKNASELFW
jgi:hypothetical protein